LLYLVSKPHISTASIMRCASMHLKHPIAVAFLVAVNLVDAHTVHHKHHKADKFLKAESEPSSTQSMVKKAAEMPMANVNDADSFMGDPCQPETDGCKSMCRWLKMTDRSTGTTCPLFEWQLKACEYTPPEDRVVSSEEEPLDCAVNLMRTFVLPSQVDEYVTNLGECINGLPERSNATCHVALGLVRNEISDWRKEAKLKGDAAAMRKELEQGCRDAQEALDSKQNVEEMVQKLTELLERSEELPGHYLVEDVHTAREFLDKLAPIPAVREQLEDALADGKEAFATVNLFRVKEAIVWLHVAVSKAVKFSIGPPTDEATETLDKLVVLKEALEDLNSAIFTGNVSTGTKSGVPEAMDQLTSSMQRCRDAGLTNEMAEAGDLLAGLQVMNAAIMAEQNATAIGEEILETAGNKGSESLKKVGNQLNTSVSRAQDLGLGDNASTAEAVATLDKIMYTRHARAALQAAIARGRDVLSQNGSELSDDAEESAQKMMDPAIEWGQEVGLVNGLDVAKETVGKLRRAESAKENMTLALAQGNTSLQSKTSIAKAIEMLQAAIEGDSSAQIDAGVNTARREIEQLKGLLAAQEALATATRTAKEALRTRTGYDDAIEGMKAALKRASSAGLDAEVELGEDQTKKLGNFVEASNAVEEAFAQELSDRESVTPAPIEDIEPSTVFKRTGLKVEDLPSVASGDDDGDDDFDEHITALRVAIDRSKRRGLVDPGMQDKLEQMVALKAAYEQLEGALSSGSKALDEKAGIATAITELSSAVEEAHETGLSLDVAKAGKLLDNLSVIQPARDEIQAAILQANVSVSAVSGMDAALVRLNKAIEVNKQLGLYAKIKEAERLGAHVLEVKKCFVTLRAATMQGEIALQTEQGEEAAITELNVAIEAADVINLHKGMPIAIDLLHELMHMNAEKQQLQAAMDPKIR